MSKNASDVLIVEDTLSLARVYADQLERAGYSVTHVERGDQALEHIARQRFDLVLLDLQLPDMNGLEILSHIRSSGIPSAVVVVTSEGSIKIAVEAMQAGAYDFVVKPVNETRLITSAANAIERVSLTEQVAVLSDALPKDGFHGFIGSSAVMAGVYKMIESVARSKAAVFVSGESGTGKEVCAEAIHRAGSRAEKRFVALNCAAIPKDLIESELFGHVKGAFTGATADRTGAAMQADGGTLFLDEICEMELALQSKLLRFLQTGQVQRVGSDKLETVDVRVISATNRNPITEVAEGRFREDLFYRLHVVPIEMPPLRARGADIIELASAFLAENSKEEGKAFQRFDAEAEELLLRHTWPGNVRELQNTVRNIVVLHDADEVSASMLPDAMHVGSSISARRTLSPATPLAAPGAAPRSAPNPSGPFGITIGDPLWLIEKQVIEATIDMCQGSIPKASRLLGVSHSTIYRKMESWAARDGDPLSDEAEIQPD